MRKSDEILHQPGGDHRGSRQARAGTLSREAGVGGQEGGRGSFSGGDVDTDITGVGTGWGVSESGPDDADEMGAAETTGGSETFASGGPAQGQNQPAQNRRQAQLKHGDTVDHSGGDATTSGAVPNFTSVGPGRFPLPGQVADEDADTEDAGANAAIRRNPRP